MNTEQGTSVFRMVSGGICSLIVAMGVGRFAYTPLLPAMQDEFNMTNSMAGLIASLNYAGYLLGAVLCQKSLTPAMKLRGFRYSLIACLISICTMGLSANAAVWMVLRFVGGVASAGVFVLGAAIVMDELHKSTSSHRAILIYSGVGLGIALSGIVSPLLIRDFGVGNAWIGLSLLCVPLALWSLRTIVPQSREQHAETPQKGTTDSRYSNILVWLVVAYFCEGFGYIVSGTFLVSFLQNEAGASSSGNSAWVIVGLAASVSVPLFHFVSKRLGPVLVLILAHGLQAVGIMLPVLSSHWLFVNAGAIIFGATFMGITALTLFIGKSIRPESSHTVIGLLTAVYGVGQILGPLIAGILSTRSGSFHSALMLSSVTVALGGVFLIIGRQRNTPEKKRSRPRFLRYNLWIK